MKLKSGTIFKLAEMVCGQTGTNPEVFPYRSLSEIERFFVHCDIEGFVAGSRQPVVRDVLTKANAEADGSLLPSAAIVRVIQGLMDITTFARFGLELGPALAELNKALGREGLEAFLDGANNCQLRAGEISTASVKPETPGFSKRELEHRGAWTRYLESVGEDDFTIKVLLPLLLHVGYQRVAVAGHEDKSLEYGKDLWMKFKLPTGHWIYFGVQVKAAKIDSAASSKRDNENVATIYNQINMALDNPIHDPDFNKNVLVDHMYLVATGSITKAARNWLAAKLDLEARRRIIFMDRDDILRMAVKSDFQVPVSKSPPPAQRLDSIVDW